MPLGAQVDLTEGMRLNTLSSWKTIHAPLALAFFYFGPALIDPLFDGLVVALYGPSGWTLAVPSIWRSTRQTCPGWYEHSLDAA